jgi:hypothetical protein
MMRAVIVSLTLLASPAVAQDADDASVVALTIAIEESGCTVTPENGDAVLAASGLSEDNTMPVIAAMYADGLIALAADGTMTLTNEVCG